MTFLTEEFSADVLEQIGAVVNRLKQCTMLGRCYSIVLVKGFSFTNNIFSISWPKKRDHSEQPIVDVTPWWAECRAAKTV